MRWINHFRRGMREDAAEINMKGSIILDCALAVNNLDVGIGASIAGLKIYLTAFFTFLLTLAAITLRQSLANRYLSKEVDKSTTLYSGLLIIILGIYELIF